MTIEGRVAIVTGGASGIGAGIAQLLAENGARTAIVDLNEAAAISMAERIGGSVIGVGADLSDEDQVSDSFAEVQERLGPVEILVNNAGVIDDAVPFDEMSASSWDRMMRINTRSQFLCSREATRSMKPAKHGRIINIVSRSWLGNVGIAGYSSSKGAVISLTRSLAIELGPFGITANAVSPALVVTPLFEGMPLDEQERTRERAKSNPIGRLGLPLDIAHAVMFFASDETDYVTGQHLYVSGGAELMSSST